MAGTASILMRAFRSADSSFFTWRAGAYDPQMTDAVGDQAPPFPIIDYSDHVVIGAVEGPLARTDPEATAVAGLGTPGTPITFGNAASPSPETFPGTDCRDFDSITYWVVLTNKGTATNVTLDVAWSWKDNPANAGDVGELMSDDQISAGVSPQNVYQTVHTWSVGTVPQGFMINVPVRGRRSRVSLFTDTGDAQGYVVAMRIA